jgi:exodeoxyribonuclease-5
MMSRQALGLRGAPRKGDLVVALRNYPPVCNGMRGRLTRDASEGYRPWHLGFGVEFIEEEIAAEVLANAAQFNRVRPFESLEELTQRGIDVDMMSKAGQLYDFGYALTCHKMQGSQAAHVVVYLDRPEHPENEDWRRWAYTSVTRASERLTVLR